MSRRTAELPNHRSVVRGPSNGSPPWSQASSSFPRWTFRCVPTVNHSRTTITSTVATAANTGIGAVVLRDRAGRP
jgi:hypothetical protein